MISNPQYRSDEMDDDEDLDDVIRVLASQVADKEAMYKKYENSVTARRDQLISGAKSIIGSRAATPCVGFDFRRNTPEEMKIALDSQCNLSRSPNPIVDECNKREGKSSFDRVPTEEDYKILVRQATCLFGVTTMVGYQNIVGLIEKSKAKGAAAVTMSILDMAKYYPSRGSNLWKCDAEVTLKSGAWILLGSGYSSSEKRARVNALVDAVSQLFHVQDISVSCKSMRERDCTLLLDFALSTSKICFVKGPNVSFIPIDPSERIYGGDKKD